MAFSTGLGMKPLGGGRFAVTVTWRIVAFVAVSILFPTLVAGIMALSGCAQVGGACAAISVITGTLLRPILLALLALSLLRPCVRRMHTLGLPALAGPTVPVLFLLDWQYLTTLGTRWTFSFGLGILNSGLPFFTILALLIIVGLAAVRSPAGPDDGLWRRSGAVGRLGMIVVLAAVIAGVVSAGLYVVWVTTVGGSGFSMGSPLLSYGFWTGKLARGLCLAAMAGVLWIIAGSAMARPRDGDGAIRGSTTP